MAIGDQVKGLSADLLQAITTRLELFGLELQQAKEDVPRLLALWVIGLLSLMFALALLTLFIVAMTWDTEYRDWVVLALFFIYAVAGGGLLWYVRERLRAGGLNPFAATLDELQRDVSCLTQVQLGQSEGSSKTPTDKGNGS
ncbi:MAG TPA: phage holin family protein [Orrella sp.]